MTREELLNIETLLLLFRHAPDERYHAPTIKRIDKSVAIIRAEKRDTAPAVRAE